jgi:DNA-binding response OmpR family regulator
MRQEIYCGLTDQHLLVEEDDIMRELLHRSLAGAGFSVHSAADGTEALGWSQQHQGTIEILVSDIMLPGLGGIELSQRIRAARPETKFLFITGFGDQFPELQEFGIPILEKPFLPSELLRKVEDILNPGQADTGTG